MDCELLPHNADGDGYVGGSGNGQLYLFDSRTGTARDVFNLDTIAPGALTQVTAISPDGLLLIVLAVAFWPFTAHRLLAYRRWSGSR